MDDLLQLYLALCEDVDTPISLGCWLRFKYGEWDSIASNRVEPRWYCNPDIYKMDVVVVDLLRKCQDLPVTTDKRAAAVTSFLESEKICARTNSRLIPFLSLGLLHPDEEWAVPVINRVRERIRRILGRVPGTISGRFGPGATLSDTGERCTVPHKCCSDPTITLSALQFLPIWAETAWARGLSPERVIDVVDYDRFTTVGKTALTDRGICIPPSVNGFFQLGVGELIRQRLRQNAGIDLQTAQPLHRQVAKEGSISGLIGTIDLKSASDTIASGLVKLLLPYDWYLLLNSLRVTHADVFGKRYWLEKFSSMGNGYTFELETLLFLAISLEASSHKESVLVYGDDIICHTDDVKDVIRLLRFFGFTPNVSKTFWEGPFRESCGGDFFGGVDVRPHYLKELPREPQEWIAFANGIRRVGSTDSALDPRFLRCWRLILSKIPADIRRCRGPAELGDLLLHDQPEFWNSRRRSSTRFFRCYLPEGFKVVEWRRFPASAVLAAALYGSRNAPVKGHAAPGIIPRNGVTGYALGWVPLS